MMQKGEIFLFEDGDKSFWVVLMIIKVKFSIEVLNNQMEVKI